MLSQSAIVTGTFTDPVAGHIGLGVLVSMHVDLWCSELNFSSTFLFFSFSLIYPFLFFGFHFE